MTPHEQDMTELVDRLRGRLENWAAESTKQAGEIGDLKRRLVEVEAERDALKAAIAEVRGDAERQRNETGTTADNWKRGVYAQACRTLRVLNRAMEPAALAVPESPGDAETDRED